MRAAAARRRLGLPRCWACSRTIWWWQVPTHRRAIRPMHFDCYVAPATQARIAEENEQETARRMLLIRADIEAVAKLRKELK